MVWLLLGWEHGVGKRGRGKQLKWELSVGRSDLACNGEMESVWAGRDEDGRSRPCRA